MNLPKLIERAKEVGQEGANLESFESALHYFADDATDEELVALANYIAGAYPVEPALEIPTKESDDESPQS